MEEYKHSLQLQMKEQEAKKQLNLVEKCNNQRQSQQLEAEVRSHEKELRQWRAQQKNKYRDMLAF